METMFQSLNWSNDLEIDEPRQRGFIRLRSGGLLLFFGFIIALIGVPQAGGIAALGGVGCLPCGALETMTNQSWSDARPLTRYIFFVLGLIAGFPLFFAAILLPVAWLN
jgi:hypothetical protein